MTKSESVTSSETCEKLAQLLEQSIAYSNRITTQLAFYTESTIIGYRDQITDNVKVLFPQLKASCEAAGIVLGDGATVHIITVGQEPAVRACVFSGCTNGLMKLIHAAEATDTATALKSLMIKTTSMLATSFNYTPKTVSKHTTRRDSGVAGFDISPPAQCSGTTVTGTPTPATTPSKSRVSQIKTEARAEGKTQHTSTKSDAIFFDGATVNNQTFLETCGEPNNRGKDSAFFSRDGEIHPRRSFVLANNAAAAAVAAVAVTPAAAVPTEEDDAIFF